MAASPIANEQRLLQLCRRLLRHNEDLHAQLDRLYGRLHSLCKDYGFSQEQAAQERSRFAAERTTLDIALGAAIDEALKARKS